LAAETHYLALPDVVALHEVVMLRFGKGPSTLRDEGALESAINRPETAAYYEGADLVEQAALLAVGISQAQAFVDGNKRTAYVAARVFLELNGQTFVGEPLELARWLEDLAEDSRNQALRADFAGWLRGQVAAV
jgi:death-on-curing protein